MEQLQVQEGCGPRIMDRCVCGRILETSARNEIWTIFFKKKKESAFFDFISVCDAAYG